MIGGSTSSKLVGSKLVGFSSSPGWRREALTLTLTPKPYSALPELLRTSTGRLPLPPGCCAPSHTSTNFWQPQKKPSPGKSHPGRPSPNRTAQPPTLHTTEHLTIRKSSFRLGYVIPTLMLCPRWVGASSWGVQVGQPQPPPAPTPETLVSAPHIKPSTKELEAPPTLMLWPRWVSRSSSVFR